MSVRGIHVLFDAKIPRDNAVTPRLHTSVSNDDRFGRVEHVQLCSLLLSTGVELHIVVYCSSFVAGECARGIADVSLEYDLPIGFGVLTVNNVDQALARAEEGEANKGREAALAAIEMADLLERLS